MQWRKVTGVVVVGAAVLALSVALALRVAGQPAVAAEEPVCAADAAATVAAETSLQAAVAEAAYGAGLEAFAPGGSRLCVTAAQMKAEAEAAQALESTGNAPGTGADAASDWVGSCVAEGVPEVEVGDCGGSGAGCGENPGCGG
jgi:hypothetical protein